MMLWHPCFLLRCIFNRWMRSVEIPMQLVVFFWWGVLWRRKQTLERSRCARLFSTGTDSRFCGFPRVSFHMFVLLGLRWFPLLLQCGFLVFVALL